MDNTTNALPKSGVGQMQEVSGNTGELGGRPGLHEAGLYRHENGAEMITQNDPLLGDAQGRAAERMGFKYVGPAPEGSIKVVGAPSEDHANKPERNVEAQEAELRELRAFKAAHEAELSRKAAPGAERTKEAAAQNVSGQTETETEETELSYRELQAKAKELGVSSKGSAEELSQRVAEAEAQKENE